MTTRINLKTLGTPRGQVAHRLAAGRTAAGRPAFQARGGKATGSKPGI